MEKFLSFLFHHLYEIKIKKTIIAVAAKKNEGERKMVSSDSEITTKSRFLFSIQKA